MIAFAFMFLTLFAVFFAVLRLVFTVLTSRFFAGLCNAVLIIALIVGLMIVIQLYASK